jgi:hypothetical protein
MSENFGIDSCLHYELSEIKINKDKIYFPLYYLDDYYLDFFVDMDIPYFIENDKCYVMNSDICWEELYMIRTESYRAIYWYKDIEDLTYKSEFIPYENIDDITNFPNFVKLDSVSCKDTEHSGIFYSLDELKNTFKRSSRISNTLNKEMILEQTHYLFVREVATIDIELRCFIRHSKLTAVSCNTFPYDKNIIHTFINNIILPYTDCVVDVAYNNGDCKIIEINNFGADSPAGAGNFNWKEDYFILYGLYDNKPVWRFSSSLS